MIRVATVAGEFDEKSARRFEEEEVLAYQNAGHRVFGNAHGVTSIAHDASRHTHPSEDYLLCELVNSAAHNTAMIMTPIEPSLGILTYTTTH